MTNRDREAVIKGIVSLMRQPTRSVEIVVIPRQERHMVVVRASVACFPVPGYPDSYGTLYVVDGDYDGDVETDQERLLVKAFVDGLINRLAIVRNVQRGRRG